MGIYDEQKAIEVAGIPDGQSLSAISRHVGFPA